MSKIIFIIPILLILIMSPLFASARETDKSTTTVTDTSSTHGGGDSSSIELLGIFVGICIVVYQMSRQHRSNLQLQRNNFKEKLHLEIYQGLIKGIDDTSNLLSKVSAKSSNIPIALETYHSQAISGVRPTPPRYRALDFHEAHYALIRSVAKLFHIFERYTIAVPKFRIFQIGLGSAVHDAGEAYQPFFQKVSEYLPIDVQESDRKPGSSPVIVPAIPNDGELKFILELGQKYNNTLVVIVGFLHDLTVESQNILLGSLFENRVPPRQPLDPNVVVITTDKDSMEKLEKYFNDETSWGKNKRQIEDYVLSEITTLQKKA